MPTTGSGSATAAVSSGYPTASDLETFLENHGFTLTAAQVTYCTTAIEAAIAEFERATDRKPVLAGNSLAKQYDPPTAYLDGACTLFLGRDLATLTSLTYQPTGASAATTYTRGTDFQLLSYDADDTDEARSFDRVVFYNRRWVAPLAPSQRRSLTITGTWGFSSSVPADIFAAMLARGAWGMWSQATYSLTGGRLSWKEQDVTEDFGIMTQTALRDTWDEQFKASVRRYRRLTL